jgi:hypothetical protein
MQCYNSNVYWPHDQDEVCHETKSFTIVISHSLPDQSLHLSVTMFIDHMTKMKSVMKQDYS